MFKVICAAFMLSALIACGGAPAPTRASLQGYTVTTERDDRAAGTLSLIISFAAPATEDTVKPVVESVIANKKADYTRIIVKSYVQGAGPNDPPLAISRLENGQVTHHFNATAENEKIKSH
jgi:hypothetical protein